MRLWPWARTVVAATTPPFDALVDLHPDVVPPGLRPAVAAAAVADAVRALPGAAWISVEVHRGDRPATARLFAAGSSLALSGPAWHAVQTQVETLARAAMHDSQAAAPPFPRPSAGFAEASAPSPLAALEALAALAQSVRAAPPPAPPARPTAKIAEDAAMLVRLLRFVLPEGADNTARVALSRFGSFAAVLAAPETELRQVPGLGTHSVSAIKLVHEAAVRLARAGVTGQPVLDDHARLVTYLSAALARERVEQFRILFLDDRGMLKADEVQATGTVNHTPVYPREVVRRALELGAAALVLVHNHPSGDPTPSSDDITMTEQIREAAAALSIVLRDHLIVGNGRTFSFSENGLL